MIHAQFIVTTSFCVTTSLTLGVFLTAPSFLDTVEAYERTDSALYASTTTLVTATAVPEEISTDSAPSPLHEEDDEVDENNEEIETPHVTQEEPEDADVEETTTTPPPQEKGEVFSVPFYSQFQDITSPSWKKVGCGIASLAMLIEFHKPGELTSVDTLLQEGIDTDAYLSNAGWTYAGLIAVSKKYGLSGTTHDYGGSGMETAYAQFLESLEQGPVMASVHYTFEPTNPIPHLVVINGVEDGVVFYNDPAEAQGSGTITEEKFKSSWKKRYIEFFPAS